jgi:hypothetical protein
MSGMIFSSVELNPEADSNIEALVAHMISTIHPNRANARYHIDLMEYICNSDNIFCCRSQEIIEKFIPECVKTKYNISQWVAKVNPELAKLQSNSPIESMQSFLGLISNWTFFGGQLYRISVSMTMGFDFQTPLNE